MNLQVKSNLTKSISASKFTSPHIWKQQKAVTTLWSASGEFDNITLYATL